MKERDVLPSLAVKLTVVVLPEVEETSSRTTGIGGSQKAQLDDR